MADPSDNGHTRSAVITALGANAFIAVTKLVAAFLSGSAAMLAEGFHSIADTGNQGFLLYGLSSARREPDEKHPFGYGKDAFFWAFVVAVSLFTLGSVTALYKGYTKLFEKESHHSGSILLLNVCVLTVAIVAESVAFKKAWTGLKKNWKPGGFWATIRQSKNSTLLTIFFEDFAALTGLAIALGGVLLTWWTQNHIYDGISSMLIGVLLALVAFLLAYETRALLLGERASTSVLDYVTNTLDETEEVQEVRSLKTLQLGPQHVLIAAIIRFDPDMSVREVDEITDAIQENVREKHPEIKHLYLEVEDGAGTENG